MIKISVFNLLSLLFSLRDKDGSPYCTYCTKVLVLFTTAPSTEPWNDLSYMNMFMALYVLLTTNVN